MSKIYKFIKGKKYILNMLLFILAFVLPFLSEKYFDNYNISIVTIGIVVVCLIEIMVTYESYIEARELEQKIENEQNNEIAQNVLSYLNLLHEEKTEMLKERTYLKNNVLNDVLLYNVHGYMKRICENLRFIISEIIEENIEYIDISFIYKYAEEGQWKWIIGKSGTSDARNLNEIVEDNRTFFHYIINNTEESPVFYNMKEELIVNGNYKIGRRDRLFDNKGSLMALVLTYYNNERRMVDAVLTISTYGVRFVDVDKNQSKEINKIKKRLVYDVLPYYVSLLQSEMGAMYLRHNKCIADNS